MTGKRKYIQTIRWLNSYLPDQRNLLFMIETKMVRFICSKLGDDHIVELSLVICIVF